ncbi:MAG: PolC-type DNA polymerase III N-terminal domain-containing protein, partial [Clostridia bacterium]
MNETSSTKTLKEIFRDYNSNSFALNDAKIKTMNLFKKTNTLQLTLISEAFIPIKAIYQFEKYLEGRFSLKAITIKIEKQENDDYQEEISSNCENTGAGVLESNIIKEWPDIIAYMSMKHPMTKAFLAGSTISIEGKAANIFLKLKGKEFLLAKKFDEILSEVLQDIYGKVYKVSYIEEIGEDFFQKQQAYQLKAQEEAILLAQKEAQMVAKEVKKEPKEKEKKEK